LHRMEVRHRPRSVQLGSCGGVAADNGQRDEPRDVREVDGLVYHGARLGRDRVRRDGVVRVSEIPGQVVHVAEDVAARAGGFAVAREVEGVVEEGPPRDHAYRLGAITLAWARRRRLPGENERPKRDM